MNIFNRNLIVMHSKCKYVGQHYGANNLFALLLSLDLADGHMIRYNFSLENFMVIFQR